MLFNRTLLGTALVVSLGMLVQAGPAMPGSPAHGHIGGLNKRHHQARSGYLARDPQKYGLTKIEIDALEKRGKSDKKHRRCKPKPPPAPAPAPDPEPVKNVAQDNHHDDNNNNNDNNDNGGGKNDNNGGGDNNNDNNGGGNNDNHNDDGGNHHHGGGGGGETFTGDATFYSAGETACGPSFTTDDYIGALNFDQFDMFGSNGNPNESPMCGRSVTLHYQGNSVSIKIWDKCEGCAWGAVDMTPTAFQHLASLDKGRLHGMTWSFD